MLADRRKNNNTLALAALITVFILLGWYGMKADLPYSRAASEVEQVRYAVKFGSGDLNPHHFWHGPVFAYLLFALYGIFFLAGKMAGAFSSVTDFQKLFFTDASAFYIIARYAVLILAAASIAVLYSAEKRLFDKRAALMASALTALSPLYVKMAHYGGPDIPVLFLSSVCIYFTVRIFEYGRMTDYILTGIFFGLSLTAKYGAGFLAIPIFAAHLLSGQGGGIKVKILDKKLPALFICTVIGMFAGNPFSFIDYKTFLATISIQSKKMSSFNYNFDSWKTTKAGWVYILTDTMPFGLGWLPAIFIMAGVLYALYRRKREDYLLLSLILTAYLLAGRWKVIKPRYFIFVFPFGFLLGARFAIETLKKIRVADRVRTWIICILTALLVIEPLFLIMKFERSVSRKPVWIQAKDWIESNVPSMSGVAAFAGVSAVPLVPNRASINRKLATIEEKKLGEGIMLKYLQKYLGNFSTVYDVYELPYPWREDYDDKIFDFSKQLNDGVKYFIFTQEVDEYYANPGRYGAQVRYIEDVRRNCSLVKEFRQVRPMIEPGYVSDIEYVDIYEYKK